MAIKTLHLTNSFHIRSGGTATFYLAMLSVANQQQREMRLIVPGTEDRMEQVGQHGRIYYVRAPEAPIDGEYRCMHLLQYLHRDHTMRRILREERRNRSAYPARAFALSPGAGPASSNVTRSSAATTG
jgi:hypothetical protein